MKNLIYALVLLPSLLFSQEVITIGCGAEDANTTNTSLSIVYNTNTNLYEFVITDSNGDTTNADLGIELFNNVDTSRLSQLICDIANTKNTNITISTISNEYQDSNFVVNTITGSIDTIVECTGEPDVFTNFLNIPSDDPNAASDTTLQITTTIDNCGQITKDTITTWSKSFCVGDDTCVVGFTEFRGEQQSPICVGASQEEVFDFPADITIYEDGNTDCFNFSDNNGDNFNVNSGTIGATTGVTVTGNNVVINNTTWSVEITGAPIEFQMGNSGTNTDFFIELSSLQIEVDTVCQPLCNPAETETVTTPPDAATGVATATFKATKLGSPVADGECVSLFFEGSDGTLIQQFDGLTGDAISTFTNYNSAWFPDGSEQIGHSTTIQINKKQMAIDLGLNGANADSWTVYIVVGGSCAGNMTPRCPNVSAVNESDVVCEMAYKAFDNSFYTYSDANVAGSIITDNTFINNTPLGDVGFISNGSLGSNTSIVSACGDFPNIQTANNELIKITKITNGGFVQIVNQSSGNTGDNGPSNLIDIADISTGLIALYPQLNLVNFVADNHPNAGFTPPSSIINGTYYDVYPEINHCVDIHFGAATFVSCDEVPISSFDIELGDGSTFTFNLGDFVSQNY